MRRFIRIAAATAALGLALNITGIGRLPVGPLGSSEAPGEDRQMAAAPQDGPYEVYTTVLLGNLWPVPATLEAVRPIVYSERGGAEILGAQPYDYATLSERQQLVLGAVIERPAEWAGDHPIAGTQVPAGDETTGAVALVRIWGEPGAVTDVAGYEIDYRVGPFAFRAISTVNSLVVCTNDGDIPRPQGCDDAEQAASAVDMLLADSGWQLLSDEPSRDRWALRAAAEAAGYRGGLARAFVFTVSGTRDVTLDILVAPGANGQWEIATPLAGT